MPQVSLRVAKIKKSSLGVVQKHNQREEIPHYVDQKISHLNQAVIGGKSLTSDVLNRISNLGITIAHGKQNESTVAMEIVLSASPEYFRNNPEERGTYDAKKTIAWCEANTQFLKSKFGDNLVRLDLHMDEATPHFHAIVTPIKTKKRKKRRTKQQIKNNEPAKIEVKQVLDASSMFNKQALIQLQTDAAQAVENLGIERGNRGSDATHITIKEWYADEVNHKIKKEIIAELNAEAERKAPLIKSVNVAIKEKRQQLSELDKQINTAERHLNMTLRKLDDATEKLKNPKEELFARLESVERTLSAYKEKFGPLEQEEQKDTHSSLYGFLSSKP